MGCAPSRSAAPDHPESSQSLSQEVAEAKSQAPPCDATERYGFFLYRANDNERVNRRRQLGLASSWGDARRLSRVPMDVISVRVDPSVKSICESAFFGRSKLWEVELCDGLEVIGESAFWNCESLRRIKIPASVTVIGYGAFYNCIRLLAAELCVGLETISDEAFYNTPLKSINIPSTVKNIGENAFKDCHQLLSVQLTEGIETIEESSFQNCSSLRNLLIPSKAWRRGTYSFNGCHDLLKLFDNQTKIHDALERRFVGLPIHELCYYHSQHPADEVIKQLESIIDKVPAQEALSLDISNSISNTQDCLGMTPLHILVCSIKPNPDVIRFMINKYPSSLITRDKWGCVPLIYAIWGDASQEIVDFLVNSHKSAFPSVNIDWNSMIETLCRAGASLYVIQRLLNTRQNSFPEHDIDWAKAARELTICCLVKCGPFRDFSSVWDATIQAFTDSSDYHVVGQSLLEMQTRFFLDSHDVDWQTVSEELVRPLTGWWKSRYPEPSLKAFHFLVKCNLPERLDAIGPVWSNRVKEMMGGISDIKNTQAANFFDKIHSKLVLYEREYHQMKDATTLLELALWKSKIDETMQLQCKNMNEIDQAESFTSDMKKRCHVHSGVDIVIPNVLPFLIGE